MTLYLGQGATILAAPPRAEKSTEPGNDVPEKNPWDSYEDFGRSHWHNSLIWERGWKILPSSGRGELMGASDYRVAG